ncbi:MAG: RNA methyltransferase [Thermodesulfovibrionales bacterium]|jgi:TrmH family RNA methyltransferase
MRYTTITSQANPIIKEAVKIRERHGRQRGAFLIEGPHLMEMAVLSPDLEIRRVYFSEEFGSKKEGQKLLRQVFSKTENLIEVPAHLLTKITETETPQGIAAIVALKSIALDDIPLKENPLLVVCDGIQDPGNMGTIIRLSDAVGADAVIILPGTCDPFMPKAIRATAGSIFNVPVIACRTEELISYLKEHDVSLCAADIRAERTIYETDLCRPLALAFGNEAHGVGDELKQEVQETVKIPILGKAESLNVAMSASVCLYEAVRQRGFV